MLSVHFSLEQNTLQRHNVCQHSDATACTWPRWQLFGRTCAPSSTAPEKSAPSTSMDSSDVPLHHVLLVNIHCKCPQHSERRTQARAADSATKLRTPPCLHRESFRKAWGATRKAKLGLTRQSKLCPAAGSLCAVHRLQRLHSLKSCAHLRLAFLNEQPSHKAPNMVVPLRSAPSNLTRRSEALTKLVLRKSFPACPMHPFVWWTAIQCCSRCTSCSCRHGECTMRRTVSAKLPRTVKATGTMRGVSKAVLSAPLRSSSSRGLKMPTDSRPPEMACAGSMSAPDSTTAATAARAMLTCFDTMPLSRRAWHCCSLQCRTLRAWMLFAVNTLIRLGL
jgi:hypothetical protein